MKKMRYVYDFTLFMGAMVLSSSSFAVEENAVQGFLTNPYASLLGWVVSFLAGCIAIYEFIGKKKAQRELIEVRKIKIGGRGSYTENNSGVMNIDHRGSHD